MTNPADSNQKKINAGVVFVLIAFLTMLAGGLLWFFTFRNQEPQVTVDIEPGKKAPVLDKGTTSFYIGNILAWLDDNMRDERGAYRHALNCTYDDTSQLACASDDRSNRTGAAVIWANYLYWKETRDTAALNRISKTLPVYINTDLVNTIQTSDLSCYYLLPLVNDTDLSQTIRDQAREMCIGTSYETGIGDNPPYRDQSDQIIRNILTGQSDPAAEFASELSPEAGIYLNPSWADVATDYLAKYQVDKSSGTFNLAYFHLAGALSFYAQNPDNPDYQCPLLLTSQQFCQSSDNPGDPSCTLFQYLLPKAQTALANSDLSLGNTMKCALADQSLKAELLPKLREYYSSGENTQDQPFAGFWLINEKGSGTKLVTTNALFTGLLFLP